MKDQLQSPPRLEPTPAWMAARREHLVRELAASAAVAAGRPADSRARARWRVVAVAFAVLVLATGAALAATGFDVLDWLRPDNPSEAAFAIDTGRVYSGPVPESLACGAPTTAEPFTCVPGRDARWRYVLYDRVTLEREFTREAALAGIENAEREGVVDHEVAEQVRADLKAVDDEFFQKMNLLRGTERISSPHEVRPGVLLVPPAGVPQFVTCEGVGEAALACHGLADAVVPVGAPVYGLVENDAWVERPFERQGPRDMAALFEALFGRPLTPAEERLVIVLGTAASESPAEPDGGVEVGTLPSGG